MDTITRRILSNSKRLYSRWLLSVVVVVSTLGVGICQSINSPQSFYSTSERATIEVTSLPQWEQQRWTIQQNLQAVMGPLPNRYNLPKVETVFLDSLVTPTYIRWNIRYKAYADEWVSALLYFPKRSSTSGRLPAMLALHPTGKEGKRIVDGDGRANRAYGKELAERGYVVIAPDYPSFGDMSSYDFETDRYQSGTMAAIFNHIRSVDLLSELPEVDPDRIGVIGHSLGGHNSLFVAAFDARLKVVVTSCGWTQLEYYDIGESAIKTYGGRLGPFAQQRYMPWFRDKFDLSDEKVPFNFHDIIALIAPRAVFINAPIGDSNFDYKGVEVGVDMAMPIYNFYDKPSRLEVHYPEAEHDFPTDVRMKSYEFIDKYLFHTPNKHEIE